MSEKRDEPTGQSDNVVSRHEETGVIDDRYEIVEQLGQGGMGVVYQALDTKFKRPVAVKLLHLENFNSDQATRFHQEAKALGRLHHANIITAYDFGITEDGNPYMVMDFIEGETLGDFVASNGPLSPEEFVDIFRQVISAIAHAHSKNIIHRDIKPSNILIISGENSQKVFVLDFGLAKLLAEEISQVKTSTGLVVGSPKYMSPEQIRSLPVDERTDIYMLGCTMYHSLAGKPPYIASNAMDTFKKHLDDPVPSVYDTTDDIIKEHLSNLVKKCMAKDPGDRYKTMSELLEELDRIEQLEEGASYDQPRSGENFLATNKLWIVPISFLVSLLLICVVMFFTLDTVRKSPEKKKKRSTPATKSIDKAKVKRVFNQLTENQLTKESMEVVFGLKHEYQPSPLEDRHKLKSKRNPKSIRLVLVNRAEINSNVYWIDFDGKRRLYARGFDEGAFVVHTNPEHAWIISWPDGTPVALIVTGEESGYFMLDKSYFDNAMVDPSSQIPDHKR